MSRFSYQNPGEAEAVLKQALALLNLFQGVAEPAAELARLRGIEKVYAAAVEENRRWNEIVAEELAETRKLMDLLSVHDAVRDGKPCMEAVIDAVVDLLARYGAAVQDCITLRNDKADTERSSVAAQYALRVQLDNARAMCDKTLAQQENTQP
jgi:hypothetical protein